MTRTYALLELSGPAFAEIRTKLVAAGYQQAIDRDGDREVVDMHGLAVAMDPAPRPPVDIELASILSQSTKEGKVELKVNGETVQMDLAKAREVHGMLGSAIEAAVSDQLLFAFLTQNVGFSQAAAARALLDFPRAAARFAGARTSVMTFTADELRAAAANTRNNPKMQAMLAQAATAAEAQMQRGEVDPGCHVEPYLCRTCHAFHTGNRTIEFKDEP